MDCSGTAHRAGRCAAQSPARAAFRRPDFRGATEESIVKKYDRDRGLSMFDEVYCGDLGQLPAAGASKFIDHMLETLFAELWADGTLSIRDRRLLLLGAIAAQGDDTTLTIQARSALKRGELSGEQLDAMALFLTQYVGYPKGSRVFRVVNEVKAGAVKK